MIKVSVHRKDFNNPQIKESISASHTHSALLVCWVALDLGPSRDRHLQPSGHLHKAPRAVRVHGDGGDRQRAARRVCFTRLRGSSMGHQSRPRSGCSTQNVPLSNSKWYSTLIIVWNKCKKGAYGSGHYVSSRKHSLIWNIRSCTFYSKSLVFNSGLSAHLSNQYRSRGYLKLTWKANTNPAPNPGKVKENKYYSIIILIKWTIIIIVIKTD